MMLGELDFHMEINEVNFLSHTIFKNSTQSRTNTYCKISSNETVKEIGKIFKNGDLS